MTGATFHECRELGYAIAEFWRQIPYALKDYEYSSPTDNRMTAIRSDGTQVYISLEALPSRRLSQSWTMPLCRATFVFRGTDHAGVTAFMTKFDSAFRRGGG